MRNKQVLLSGRAVTSNAANAAADRYSFLHLSDAEPNLGTAEANDYVLVFNTHANSTGNRLWSTQLITAYANANAAFAKANAAFANANGAFAAANSAFANANGAFAKSNAGYNQANSGFIQANSAFIHANSAYQSQNATGQYANSAFVHANSAFGHANAAYQSQNATGQYANSAFVHANAAYQSQNATGQYANAAFIRANNSLDANNGGTVTGDVRISGNLTVAGGITYVNTSTVLIADNIITLNAAIDQASAPTVDAGIEVDRGSAANVYVLWNETIDKWTVTNDGVGYYGLASDAAESYANSAFTKANAAFGHANAAYTSQNATGQYANAAFSVANGAFFHANAAFITGNSAFIQANASFNTGNAAFIRANNSLDANNGGVVTGNVTFTKNVVVTGDVTSNTLTTTGSNGSISGANAIFTNYIFAANGTLDLLIWANNAYANANAAFAKANASFAYANGAFIAANLAFNHANASFANANGAFAAANAAYTQANSSFIHANSAYQSQNATGQYANAAFTVANGAFFHANAAYQSQNATGQYANAAFIHANSAYQSQNATGQYANAAFIHANSAYQSQNATGQYANAAFVRANNSLDANNGGTVTGFINVTQNVSIGTYLDLATDQSNPTRVEGRVFYDNTQHALGYYNESDMTFQIGQEAVLRVWNNTGATITDGKPVYITNDSSANGFPSVALASAATANTAEVIGITTTVIVDSGYGYVTTLGKVNGLNTSLFTEGQELFLSDTPGAYQTSAAASPSVPIVVGYVVVSDVTNGSIYVHTHLMEGRNKSNGAILFGRNGTIDQDPTTLYWDYANNSLGIGTDVPQANLHVTGSGLFTGNVVISGNLNVTNANFISTSELTVTGNTIILSDDTVGTPTLNAAIIVNRGSSANAYIRWDESIDEWTLSEGGDATHILTSGKTAETWDVYNSFDAYEKRLYPIGANLSKSIDYQANAAFTTANIAEQLAIAGFKHANSGFIHANAAFDFANTLAGGLNTVNVSISLANDHANAAFHHANASYTSQNATGQYANSAFVHANAAFDAANNALDTWVRGQANAAFIQANASFTHANSGFIHANAAFNAANNALDTWVRGQANAAFIQANSGFIHANAAFDFANTLSGGAAIDNVARITANAGFIHANAAYQSQNATGQYANAAFIRANNSLDANNGGSVSGTILSTANVRADYVVANTGFASAAGESRLQLSDIGIVSLQVAGQEFKFGGSGIEAIALYSGSYGGNKLSLNNETKLGSYVYDTVVIETSAAGATNQFTFANNSFTVPGGITANGFTAGGINVVPTLTSSFDKANAAFIRANNSLDANNGGTVTGDVRVTGNLTVTGTTTYVNTSTVLIADNIITLNAAIDQASAPTVDAGIEVDRGNAANVYMLWNETEDRWTFTNDGVAYDGVGYSSTAPYANAAFTVANGAFFHANAGFSAQNTTGQYANSAFLQANAAFIVANAASLQANSAFFHANGAYQSQNATGQYANSAFVHANSAFDHANAAYQSQNTTGNYANSAFTVANGAFFHANAGFIIANVALLQANAAFEVANVAILQANSAFFHANGAFVAANSAGVYANGAFDAANSAGIYANSAYRHVNSAFDHANSGFITANSAFIAANGALINAASAGAYANSAFLAANVADSKAVASGNYANAAFIRANNSLDANNGGSVTGTISVTGNVYGAYVVANSGFTSTAGGSKLELTDIGLVVVDVASQQFKFGAAGIESNPGIYGGAFGGNKLSLNNETNLISDRFDMVKIQTGENGTVKNEFTFANNAFTAPGRVTAISFVAGGPGGINIAPTLASSYNHANAAFDYANTATGAVVTFAAQPPASGNSNGHIWIDSADGTEYTYFKDSDTFQWVEFGPSSSNVSMNTYITADISSSYNHANAAFDKANSSITSDRLSSNLAINIIRVLETANIYSTAVGGNVNIDISNNTSYFFSSNTTANVTFNLRANGNAGGIYDSLVNIGQTSTVAIALKQGSTRYKANLYIDGVLQTLYWLGNSAPNYATTQEQAIDVYSFVVFKTAANTYSVLAANSNFGLAQGQPGQG